MECKMIQQWVDIELDSLLTEDQALIVNDHISSCAACHEYRLEVKRIDSQLRSNFEITETELKTSKIMNKIKPRKKSWTVAASLVILLGLTFNNQLHALMSNFPLVGELLDYFNNDEGVGYAKDHGYPVHDMVFKTEDLTLFIKDFYVDKYGSTCQYAVQVNGDFVVPDEFEVTFENGRYSSQPGQGDFVSQKDPWIKEGYFPNLEILEENDQFDINIILGDKSYHIEKVTFLYEKIDYETKYIDINQVIQTSDGPLEIVKLELHPSTVILHYIENESISFPEIKIVLDHERVIHNNYHYVHGEGRHRKSEFKSSFYYDDVSEIQIELSYVGQNDDKLIGYVDYKNEDFHLDLDIFYHEMEKKSMQPKLDNIVFYEDTLTFDIIYGESKSESNFPTLYEMDEDMFHKIETLPSTSLQDKFVAIPHYVLNDWFGENVHHINSGWLDYNDINPYIYYEEYSLGELEALLEVYGVKKVNLNNYFMDRNVYISNEEIALIINKDLNPDEYTRNQLTDKDITELLVYLYETYDLVCTTENLTYGSISGRSNGLRFSSSTLLRYKKMSYKLDKVSDLDNIYHGRNYRSDAYTLKIDLKNKN